MRAEAWKRYSQEVRLLALLNYTILSSLFLALLPSFQVQL